MIFYFERAISWLRESQKKGVKTQYINLQHILWRGSQIPIGKIPNVICFRRLSLGKVLNETAVEQWSSKGAD